MPLRFKSLCSGSSGNAALLWTKAGALLLDFAPGSQRRCRQALEDARALCPAIAGVLVTHAHGDHINANSLKVLREAGLQVRCHPEVARQIAMKYGSEWAPGVIPFERSAKVGDFKVAHLRVPHAPNYCTTAFVITAKADDRRRKVCLFTDLCAFTDEHVATAADADFIFLEANHDLELLKKFGHPGSEFHLSNLQAARFLHKACGAGAAQPQAVVLGHLSEECNRPHLPALEIAAYFNRKKLAVKFEVHLAARHEPGPVIVIK